MSLKKKRRRRRRRIKLRCFRVVSISFVLRRLKTKRTLPTIARNDGYVLRELCKESSKTQLITFFVRRALWRASCARPRHVNLGNSAQVVKPSASQTRRLRAATRRDRIVWSQILTITSSFSFVFSTSWTRPDESPREKNSILRELARRYQ